MYQKENEPFSNFKERQPATFHMAFVSDDAKLDKERLIREGASLVEEVKREGVHLVMLRDPWGMPLQLCQRANKF
ncbi:VOC family protein [Zobellia alginiliquefaciens]|uniref:VOC family protein n=1 Tax=Zobellia alginiliquefaciens TaxID=3032586 RepID=UPI0032C41CEB